VAGEDDRAVLRSVESGRRPSSTSVICCVRTERAQSQRENGSAAWWSSSTPSRRSGPFSETRRWRQNWYQLSGIPFRSASYAL
jgi:hypothetical protein